MSGTLARHDENRFKPDRSWRPVRFIFKGEIMKKISDPFRNGGVPERWGMPFFL
jgi:hypothetical protein